MILTLKILLISMHHNILISALKNVRLFFETKNWNIKPDTLIKYKNK